jgi:hypothetical protein
VRIRTRGGEELIIHFRQNETAFDEVWLEGGTAIVYVGRLHEEAL